MWHWDQGRMEYFQFANLCAIARFVVGHNFKAASRTQLEAATGLPFKPDSYAPWRNYSRVLKQCLLVRERGGLAVSTPVATLLAEPGRIAADEYLHFVVEHSTEPSPAFEDWQSDGLMRFPLLFSLKYLLAKAAIEDIGTTPIYEIIGAYQASNFAGSEGEAEFISLARHTAGFEAAGKSAPENLKRQARESFRLLSQISYLFQSRAGVSITLASDDARAIFADLEPVSGPFLADGNDEIERRAKLFSGGSTHDFFDYPHTTLSEVAASGFPEGTKVQKTHVTIERNAKLRQAFFARNRTTVCDVCTMDTRATYPWTERVMDLHHLLPLASGTRVEATGTTLDDLVPICPSCHRAVHRYYGSYFKTQKVRDFASRDEAVGVYEKMKYTFKGIVHA